MNATSFSRRLRPAAAILLLLGATSAAAQGQLDQSFTTPSDLGGNINECCALVAQTFTAGKTGVLAGIRVDIGGRTDTLSRLRLAVTTVTNGVPDAELGAVVLPGTSSGLDELVTFTGVRVTAGVQYAIVASYVDAPPPGGGQFQGIWSGAIGDFYPRGEMLILYGTSWEYQGLGYDLHFETFVAPLDADGDGWTIEMNPPDCDDADPAVHPWATEVPRDGVDQDCSGHDAVASYALRNDATGGQCTLVGAWDAATGTCTLGQDLVLPRGDEPAFVFESGDVTLDGGGHRITAAVAYDGGWVLAPVRGWGPFANITVRNLSIGPGFNAGIFFNQLVDGAIENVHITRATWAAIQMRGGSTNVRIRGNQLLSNYQGLRLENVSGFLIEDNTVTDGYDGFNIIYGSSDNTVVGNRVIGQENHMNLTWGHRTDVHDNLFEDVRGWGRLIVIGDDNRFYNNDFIGDFLGAWKPDIYPDSNRTLFSLPAPIGGNYWSDPDAACVDADGNGFCDAPLLLLDGAQDALPWAVRSGWKDEDGDGANKALDCDDANPAAFPGAPEVPYDGVDQSCNGMADDDDLDRDGFPLAADCDDANAARNPGAAEVQKDGVDQDCNGWDLTIDVPKATYHGQNDALRVEATSALGAGAALQVVGYGAMSWDPVALRWILAVRPAGGNPGTVTVAGVEGATSATLRVQ